MNPYYQPPISSPVRFREHNAVSTLSRSILSRTQHAHTHAPLVSLLSPYCLSENYDEERRCGPSKGVFVSESFLEAFPVLRPRYAAVRYHRYDSLNRTRLVSVMTLCTACPLHRVVVRYRFKEPQPRKRRGMRQVVARRLLRMSACPSRGQTGSDRQPSRRLWSCLLFPVTAREIKWSLRGNFTGAAE
jgi:hypothetical protein